MHYVHFTISLDIYSGKNFHELFNSTILKALFEGKDEINYKIPFIEKSQSISSDESLLLL